MSSNCFHHFFSAVAVTIAGALKYTGLEKLAIFDRNPRLSRKRYEIGPWLVLITNRKSQVVSVPMTLSDLEKLNARGQIFRRISLITSYSLT